MNFRNFPHFFFDGFPKFQTSNSSIHRGAGCAVPSGPAYPSYSSSWRPPASPPASHPLDSAANLFSAAAAAGAASSPCSYSQELRTKMADYNGWRY